MAFAAGISPCVPLYWWISPIFDDLHLVSGVLAGHRPTASSCSLLSFSQEVQRGTGQGKQPFDGPLSGSFVIAGSQRHLEWQLPASPRCLAGRFGRSQVGLCLGQHGH